MPPLRANPGARPTRSFRSWRVVLQAAALVLVPLALHGQSAAGAPAASRFDDFWFGFALGGAGTRLTCDLCQTAREVGPAAEISFGSYARPDLRIGVEAGAWTHDDGGARESVYRTGVVAYLRPDLDRGVYFAGGFGWLRYQAGEFRYDAPRLSLGAGWDHRFGGRFRIGNQLMLDATSFGSLRNGERRVARNVGVSLVRVSVQLHRI